MPHSASKRNARLVLGLALLVAVLGNVAAKRLFNPPWLSPDRRIIGEKFRLLREGPADVLVLGDSSAAFGVNAGVLGEALGQTVHNLATFGRFEVAGSAWTLDEYLARHPAPGTVLVVHGARTWWLEASGFDLGLLPLEPGYWARREPRRSVSLQALGEFALDRWAPLYTQHRSFAAGLRGRGWAVPERPEIGVGGTLALVLTEEEARWSNPASFVERFVKPELARRVPGLPLRQRQAAEALARRAEAGGFDLVFVQAPQWDGLESVPEHVAVIDEVQAFLAHLAAASPRVHVVAGGPRGFPTDAMENPYHLLGAPAEGYSRDLAVALRALPLASRD